MVEQSAHGGDVQERYVLPQRIEGLGIVGVQCSGEIGNSFDARLVVIAAGR
jgi:hypothetical protein